MAGRKYVGGGWITSKINTHRKEENLLPKPVWKIMKICENQKNYFQDIFTLFPKEKCQKSALNHTVNQIKLKLNNAIYLYYSVLETTMLMVKQYVRP